MNPDDYAFAEGFHDRVLSLADSAGADRHLVARCGAPGCDGRATLDPEPWLRQGLGVLPLRVFSERLRCVCGSRQAALGVEFGPGVADARPSIFVFR